MEKYISKSVLISEIERRIKEYNTPIDRLGSNNIRLNECKDILSFLNTLEAKEMDLEESARDYLLNKHKSPLNEIMHQADIKCEMQYHSDIENAYKAGFEFGVKTKKGE